jgi:hypothetical protein
MSAPGIIRRTLPFQGLPRSRAVCLVGEMRLNCGDSMTEERKHAVLLATVILTARRLQPLLEEDDKAGNPNMALDFR